MATTEPTFEENAADRHARRELAAIAAIVGVLAAIIFVGWPSLDLGASRLFYLRPRTFALTGSGFADAVRSLFTLLTWAAGLAAAAGIVLAIGWRRHLLGLALPQWLFLALVLAVGPGLIANALLKDNWARPRPTQIVEFGGNQQFKPVLDRSGQCERNCSFVGGEAASIFALGFAVAMLARRRRAELLAATIAAGSFIGLIRIAEGGHFLSDIVFAGVLMGLVVALLHWVVFDVLRGRLGDETVWHDRAIGVARSLATSTARLKSGAEAWLDRRRFGRDERNDPDDDVGR
jgi:lipid A 4'-phosphatase